MGVLGLTTYLREHKSSLSKTLQFPLADKLQNTALVVDGWSLIYELVHCSDLPWVYGGEYSELSQLAITVVQAWTRVGFKVYIVFDGPYPSLKFPAIISRVTKAAVQSSLLFFRTSAISRATPRFLHEAALLPPLSYSACVQALRELAAGTDAVQLHFADEEGDPYAVELAGCLSAYVTGNDSDFVVFNTEGYLGYIPLDEMVWNNGALPQEESLEDENGFQTVRKPKGKNRNANTFAGRGVIPPDDDVTATDLTLTVSVYSPSTLAAHLQLPVSLLPLLGAIVGNDFTSQYSARPFQHYFFERDLTLSQRILRVANVLHGILAATLSPQQNRRKQQISSVMELIDQAVTTLLIRPVAVTSGETTDAIVERIVEATLLYAISRPERQIDHHVCALHPADACPLVATFSRGTRAHAEVCTRYIEAYRRGDLSPRILDVFQTQTTWPHMFLENPDIETVSRSISRQIRVWGYALLDHAIGLSHAASEESDDDELVDVVEEDEGDEDMLAPLRGVLQKLDGSVTSEGLGTGSTSPTLAGEGSKGEKPKVVTEYVRRGTRLVTEEVVVPALGDVLPEVPGMNFTQDSPIQLRDEETRLTALLQLFGSDNAAVRALPAEQLCAALTARWIISILNTRAVEHGGAKARQQEKWTKYELQAFLSSFKWTNPPRPEIGEPQYATPIDIVDRNVQLVAQTSTTLIAIEHLSQILFLANRVPASITRFSGKSFHAALTGVRNIDIKNLPEGLLDACLQGLEGALAEPRGKTGRKERKVETNSNARAPTLRAGTKSSVGGGLYGLLADMNLDT